MFLCKHHSTLRGLGINVHSVLSLKTGAGSSSHPGLTVIHIYAHVLRRSLFPLLCFSLYIPSPSHTHSHSQTLSPSPRLLARLLSLSSDFPVVHRRPVDQYIITGFEAYIYCRSNAITTVISLLPLA